jgi:HEAT repeat protein
MVNSSLLVYRSNARISFAHPVIGGYLAGCGLAKIGGEYELLSQPNWVGKRLSLQYLASTKDVSGLINQVLADSNGEPLQTSLLKVGEWPSTASKNSAWKGAVMQALATSLKEANLSLGYKGRVITALALSGDSGVPALFRQLLSSPQHEVQLLGALGSGIVQDAKAATPLNELLYSPVPNVRRAACLALASINSTESIEMVAGALLQGEDDARRAAAEALSHNLDEGHPILKEGAQIEDLAVRRAVTYGLGWIKEPWARELLENLQLEDEQWMVRTTAGQVLELLDKPNQFTPKQLLDLPDTPWLITFASERGVGLAPGRASWDMLKIALSEGNEDQRLAAMEHYRQHPQEAKAVMPVLYNFLNGNDGEMREAAYHTLWHVGVSGIPLQ